MPAEIRIYFEGDKSLRSGFDTFFAKVRIRGDERRCKLRLIATGGTPERDFNTAMKTHPTAWNILLRDSEGPYDHNLATSLCSKHGWDPSQADSIFWMVETMESWFHADKDALEAFYGSGFRRQALKPNPKVEQIPKQDLKSGLKAATKDTARGDYYKNKTRHAPGLLTIIDPDLVQRAAPNCGNLFKAVLAKLC